MTELALYLESGPRRQKTMVHVLDLLGCVVSGPTTEAALDLTPAAIRAYRRFLRRHGEPADPDEPFSTVVAEHVTKGVWLGNGDPTPGFARDFDPLEAADLRVYLNRLAGLRAELLECIVGLSPDALLAEPAGSGRSVYRIVEHAAESECNYLRYTVGKVDGLAEALKAVRLGPDGLSDVLPDALIRLWRVIDARLAALTDDERARLVPHGQVTWSARRGLRRALEHDWEHLVELRARLG